MRAILPASITLASLLCFFPSQVQSESPKEARNVQMARVAWEALNGKEYETAVTTANQCVAAFERQADKIQAQLLADNVPALPPSEIDTSEEQEKILARGPLNDVAACLFVKLSAQVQLVQKEGASKTYCALKAYPHALIWDPQGWFWDPLEGARGEMGKINLAPPSCTQ